MKITYIKLGILLLFCCVFQQDVFSQTNYLLRSTISAGGVSEKVENNGNVYIIQQVIGQSSVIGTYTIFSHDIRQGFIQPDILKKVADVNVPTNLVVDVYPNPFNSTVFIDFENDIYSTISVTVYSVMGVQILAKGFQSKEKVKLELDQLPSGEYIIKARANNMQFISKIIKD